MTFCACTGKWDKSLWSLACILACLYYSMPILACLAPIKTLLDVYTNSLTHCISKLKLTLKEKHIHWIMNPYCYSLIFPYKDIVYELKTCVWSPVYYTLQSIYSAGHSDLLFSYTERRAVNMVHICTMNTHSILLCMWGILTSVLYTQYTTGILTSVHIHTVLAIVHEGNTAYTQYTNVHVGNTDQCAYIHCAWGEYWPLCLHTVYYCMCMWGILCMWEYWYCIHT